MTMSIQIIKHHAFDSVEVTDEPIVGNAGLAAVGQLMRIADIDRVSSDRSLPNQKIQDSDVIKAICGLFATGKSGFDHIHHFDDDKNFFADALRIGRMPSEASLRQRLEAMSHDRRVHEAIVNCSMNMLKRVNFPIPMVEVPGFSGIRVDSDTSIFDNSQTKKEGIAVGYTGIAGYAPLCSFIEGGIAVGAKLCPGDHHPLHEGYEEYFKQVWKNVKGLVPNCPILWIEDAAFDSVKLMKDRHDDGDYFIIRHNQRQESQKELIKMAMEQGHAVEVRPGKTVYTGSLIRRRGTLDIRLVYEVTVRTSKKGQMLLVPEYAIFSVCTNLMEVNEDNILRIYRDRGTCEQYFAEIKSELDLERLPSGKFIVNEFILQLGMFVMNMLRVIGKSLLCPGMQTMKKATRRRLRTVIQNIMYLSGKVVQHARRRLLKVIRCNGSGLVFCGLYRQLLLT
jgi:hypothetical protein